MNKGEIYSLKNDFRHLYESNCYNHPFIYWESIEADYEGIMLTTSSNPKWNNISLKEEHIKQGFKIFYGKSADSPKSYIAPLYLLKDIKYEHLEKVGELSESGVSFINSILCKLQYTTWKSYMNQSSTITRKS